VRQAQQETAMDIRAIYRAPRTIVTLFCATFLVCSCLSMCSRGPKTIAGKVVDSTGRPIAGVTVAVTVAWGGCDNCTCAVCGSGSALTDPDGSFEVDVAPVRNDHEAYAAHKVLLSRPGYWPRWCASDTCTLYRTDEPQWDDGAPTNSCC
jgi:hypothetical protein